MYGGARGGGKTRTFYDDILRWLYEGLGLGNRQPEKLPKLNADRAKRRESPYYRPQPYSDRRLRHLERLDKDNKR